MYPSRDDTKEWLVAPDNPDEGGPTSAACAPSSFAADRPFRRAGCQERLAADPVTLALEPLENGALTNVWERPPAIIGQASFGSLTVACTRLRARAASDRRTARKHCAVDRFRSTGLDPLDAY